MYGELLDDLYDIAKSNVNYRIFNRGETGSSFKPSTKQKTNLYKIVNKLNSNIEITGNSHIDGNMMQLALFAYYNIARESIKKDEEFTSFLREENLEKQTHDKLVKDVKNKLYEEIYELLYNNHFKLDALKDDFNKNIKENIEIITSSINYLNKNSNKNSNLASSEIISNAKTAIKILSRSNSKKIGSVIKFLDENLSKIKSIENELSMTDFNHSSFLVKYIKSFISSLDEMKIYLEQSQSNFDDKNKKSLVYNISLKDTLSGIEGIIDKKHEDIKTNLSSLIESIEYVKQKLQKYLNALNEPNYDIDLLLFAFIASINNMIYNSCYYELSTLTAHSNTKKNIQETSLPIKFSPKVKLLNQKYQKVDIERINLLIKFLNLTFPN